MIAIGTAVTDERLYRTVALPGIERLAGSDSAILTRHGYDSIQLAYNEMLDEVADEPDLEAVVLMHQDLELTDDTLLERLRATLLEPRMALVGVAGSRGAPGLAWWEGSGYGACNAPGIDERMSRGPHEVETLDGVFLALAPWAARALRFDEAFSQDFHGYDVDISLQARALGGRVAVIDVSYFHHWQKDLVEDRDRWARNASRLHAKWDRRLWPSEWAGTAG